MFGYYCRYLYCSEHQQNVVHVVHTDTGCTIPYRKRLAKYRGVKIPDYKKEFFSEWFSMKAIEREMIKRETLVKPMVSSYSSVDASTGGQFKNGEGNWATPVPVPPKYSIVGTGTSEIKNSGGSWLSFPNLTPVNIPSITGVWGVTGNSLATLNGGGVVTLSSSTAYQEEETTMYDLDCEDHAATRAQNYLDGRLYSLKATKSREGELAFGLRDDDKPQTPKDLIDRITSGKYIVQPDKMEVTDYEPLRRFRWRDPAKKEDRAGYEASQKAMEAATTTVTDTIMIGTPTEALAALKAFEGTTFH